MKIYGPCLRINYWHKSFYYLIFLFILTIPLNFAIANPPLPEHASVNQYGGGWFCNKGFYKSGDVCQPVKVPENGMLDFVGNSWICQKGFYKSGNTCQPVKVPENAILDFVGNSWVCKKAFYKVADTCQPVKLPANAMLDFIGNSWVCQKGFYKSGDTCQPVKLPANAMLDFIGSSWVCKKSFYKAADTCQPVKIPENATLNYLGNDWECKKGFKKSTNICVAMTPEEISQQKQIEKAVMQEIYRRKSLGISGDNCDTESKTGAEVCVKITRGDIDCNKSYTGDSYSNCDVSLSYQLQTNYKGESYLDANVNCEVEIEYKERGGYSSQSDTDSQNKSHDLYADASENRTLDFNFSFSSYREVIAAKVSSAKCKIRSIDLW